MARPSDRLLDAVTEVLVEDGFEGVSVRKVATRAGVSIGAVQHHFPTKDAMLDALMDRASDVFQQRLRVAMPEDPSAEQALRAVVTELLALDEEGRVATVIWTQRLARAMVSEPMRARHADEWRQLEDLLTGLLRAVHTDRDEVWARDQAALLLAAVDGLAINQVVEPDRVPPARAARVADLLLASLLTP